MSKDSLPVGAIIFDNFTDLYYNTIDKAKLI